MRPWAQAVMMSLALSALVTAASSRAGEASEVEAAARFADGERAFSRGDFVKAGEAFEAAYAAKPHESALWNAARSFEKAGEIARAANLYRAYLRVSPEDAPDRKRAAVALDGLTGKLGRLELVAPRLTELTVDGRAALDPVVFVVPGTHLVEGKTEDGAVVKREVSLAAGAIESVVIDPPPTTAASDAAPPAVSAPPASALPLASATPPIIGSSSAPPRAAPEPKRHGTSPWLLAPFIGSTAIAGTFLIASGIDVLRAKSDYEDLKKGRSAEEQQQLIEAGVGKTDRTNVLVGVTGGLAIVTGIVAFTAIDWGGHDKPSAAPKPSARVIVGPRGAIVEARF